MIVQCPPNKTNHEPGGLAHVAQGGWPGSTPARAAFNEGGLQVRLADEPCLRVSIASGRWAWWPPGKEPAVPRSHFPGQLSCLPTWPIAGWVVSSEGLWLSAATLHVQLSWTFADSISTTLSTTAYY